MILLRRVLRPKLIATFVVVVAAGILVSGRVLTTDEVVSLLGDR